MPIKKKKKEEEDFKGTSTMRTTTSRGKRTHSILGPEGKFIELPEGVVPPKTFRVSDTQGLTPRFGAAPKTSREVSSTEYYENTFRAQDKARATRGEPPLTLEQKKNYIINTLTSRQFSPLGQVSYDPFGRQLSPQEFSELEPLPSVEEQRAQQVGAPGQVTPQQLAQMSPDELKQYAASIGVEPDKISSEQAWKSALAGAAGGAVGGALVGAVTTGGLGSIPLAVIGAIGGFIAGFRGNLKTQRADMLSGEAANIRKQEQNLLKIVMNTNQGGDPVVNLGYFNDQLEIIAENQARLNLITRDDVSKWLGEDGHTQLERYEIFYSPGGMRDILVMQMQQAILNPDPNKQLTGLQDVGES